MLFRRSETPDDRAELRARIVQLTAERDRLKDEQRLEAAARAELAENVRVLSMELCERSVEFRDTRRALDSLLADAFDGPHNPI